MFLQDLAFHYPYKLDIEAMNKAAKLLIGEHDFAGFCRAEGKAFVGDQLACEAVLMAQVVKNK